MGILTAVLLSGLSATAEPLFELTSIENAGRAVAARVADLDGDGRSDLMVVSIAGMPPNETREIRVFVQGDDGKLPLVASHVIPVPTLSGVYDLADVMPWPGVELVVLRTDGVRILSLASNDAPHRDVLVPEGGTIVPAEDERGFEPIKLVYDDFGAAGDPPWILIPQFGRVVAMTAEGVVEASFDVGRRTNYYIIPRTSLFSAESDVQLFVDIPKLAVGDVDGDGAVDVVSSTRHELRVFKRRVDGGYDTAPSRKIALGLVTSRDHIRGTGGVASEFADVNKDGRLDLMVSHVEGSISDATTTTYVMLNREGGWALDAPDSTFTSHAALASDTLIDIDGDQAAELLRIRVKFSVLEFIELLVTREVDTEIAIHARAEDGAFASEPLLRRKLGIAFSFDTFRSQGFMPTLSADLNRDGFADLLMSGEGDAVEVFLGGGDAPYLKRSAQQKMNTAGVIDFVDLNSDGLSDFVLFDPHNFDAPVTVAVNLGNLSGTSRNGD